MFLLLQQEIRDPEREKRRIARKKEKRATLILGLIMGSFILCWLPFFFLYILEPLCPSCQVAPWGFAIAFWLGYMNSALNPGIQLLMTFTMCHTLTDKNISFPPFTVIYTIFN
jgi:hypothetical protein